MPVKGHRSNSAGRLGRTNSATKVGTNLQFTQKDLPASKQQKKSAGYVNDKSPPFGRANPTQRIQSREQMQPLKRGNPAQKPNGARAKAGFTISSPLEDDDDEWVSSSSGVATPNNAASDSEESDGSDGGPVYTHNSQRQNHNEPSEFQQLQRVDTARPSEFAPSTLRNESHIAAPSLPPPAPKAPRNHTQSSDSNRPARHVEFDHAKGTHSSHALPLQPHHPRSTQSKKSSRPPSTYSLSEVRPHPLIRGQSGGQVSIGKPSPLAPLAVAPTLSTSPTSSIYEDPRNFLPSSPASTSGSYSDKAGHESNRRTSFSSARSVATVPVQMLLPEQNRNLDRARTLSTMSTSSSSAALSALSHLPAVTRPPSPQSVVFFPPVNPHVNTENIHPLLPGPYLNNHLTVLSRRIPLRESYDRVIRAKQAM